MVRLTRPAIQTDVTQRREPLSSSQRCGATTPITSGTLPTSLRAEASGASSNATAVHARVTGRVDVASVVPKALADDITLLSPASQMALTKLFARHADHGDAIVDVLADPALWCAPMRPNDEARVLAKAIGCVPLSMTPALQPSPPIASVTAVDARTDGRTAVANAMQLVQAAWAKGGDVVTGPEWLFVPAHGVAMTATEKDALLDTLAALTRGSDRLLVPGTVPWVDDAGGYHNTAYALSDGRVVHGVDKRGDGDDVDIATSAGFTHVSEPGGSTFAWRGVVVGLEVCRDHGDARLRHELLGSGRDTVDLQIVVSSGVWLKHAAIGIGGDVVVAQGDGIAGHERGRRDDTGRLHVEPLV